MFDPAASRRIEKTAVEKGRLPPGARFGSKTTARAFAIVRWPDVARVLHQDSTRDDVFGPYKAAGFTPDDFASRRSAREVMAEALTRTEDRLELEAKGRETRDRAAICDVRRRLEWELWP